MPSSHSEPGQPVVLVQDGKSFKITGVQDSKGLV